MADMIYRGILSGQHSWVVVGTELCSALNDIGVDIAIQSTNRTDKMDNRLRPLIDKTKDRTPIGLGYTIPRNLKQFNSDKKICIYNYETTVMPPMWSKELNQYADLILPSSTFAKNIFIQNGVHQDKTHVLPHGFDPEIYNPDVIPMDLKSDKFKFLCVAAPHARKGLDLLLRAYCEEFAANEPVMLVLKTSLLGRNRRSYEISVQDLIKHCRTKYAMPEVRVVDENLSNLAALYNACDTFVTATRSECFCIPVLEAMACKLPVIVPGYGGHTDFATPANSIHVSHKMVPAPKTMQYWHYDKRGKIAEPSVNHLRAVMRYAFTHRSDMAAKAQKGYRDVVSNYTWHNVAHQFVDLINNQRWGNKYKLKIRNAKITPPTKDQMIRHREEKLESLEEEISRKQSDFKRLKKEIDKLQQPKVQQQSPASKVSIVILNYNTKDSIAACLDSIKSNTNKPHEVIVIDNGSTDGSQQLLKQRDDITLIINKENIGVSKGWNQGIQAADPDSDIVVLNSDIVVTRDWLDKIVDCAYQDSAIGIVGCRIKGLTNNKDMLLHTGALIQRDGMGQENEWGIPLVDYGQYQLNQQAQVVVGACMFLKRQTLNSVGLFDEDYTPAYFEDSDMCMKVADAGLKVMYCGEVTLFHEHGATGRANKIDVNSLLQVNRKKFLSKWRDKLQTTDAAATVRGPIFGPSGYAEACRNLVTGLVKSNVDVACRPITAHPSERVRQSKLTNLIVQDCIHNSAEHDTSIVFYLADYFSTQFRGAKRKIGYTMLEVDGVPSSWVHQCNANLSELWVPSSFNEHTFRQAGVTVPIRVVPLGVDTARFNPLVNGTMPKRRDSFRFLSICEMGERKNVHMLMKAFQAEFKKNEPVELVLRISNHDPSINVERELQSYDLRNIVLLTRQYDVHEMPSLYRSADAFVLPSSGEGWGLPYMEAMACGLPTIGTEWSANMDFMNKDNSYLIKPARIAPAVARCPYYNGFNWAIPSVNHLRKLMRHVYENRQQAEQKGAQAAVDIQQKFDITKVAQIAKKYLQQGK